MTKTLLAGAADVAAVGRDLGTGASAPVFGPAGTPLRRGDAYYHTALYCLIIWNGLVWRQAHVAEATATQRAAIATALLYEAFTLRETDTERTWEYDGAAWQLVHSSAKDGPLVTYATSASISSWPGGQVFGGTPVVNANTDTTMFTTTAGSGVAAGNRVTVNAAGRYKTTLSVGVDYVPTATNYYANMAPNFGGTAVTGRAAFWHARAVAGTSANSQWQDFYWTEEFFLPAGADLRLATASAPQAGQVIRYAIIDVERIG
jgi:hypothetical protein